MTSERRTLERLNAQSMASRYDVCAADWTRTVDRGAFWIPTSVETLRHLPEHALLAAHERRRGNQLEALGLCEQFIWLEADLVIPALSRIAQRRSLPGALRLALRTFIEEEAKHVEMFWRLLERSEPSWYVRRRTRLFRLGPVERCFVSRVVAAPETFLVWLPVIAFVEERSLYISREYVRSQRTSPGEVDGLHTRVHELHLVDEVRHCQLDRYLLTYLHARQSSWKKRLCAMMFARFLRDYALGPSTTARAVRQLASEFPRLRGEILVRMLARLREVRRDAALRATLLRRSPLPLMTKFLRDHRENHALARHLLAPLESRVEIEPASLGAGPPRGPTTGAGAG